MSRIFENRQGIMEMLKLLKLIPMLIMVATLSYAAYTINEMTAAPAPTPAAGAGVSGTQPITAIEQQEFVGLLASVRVRDPFTPSIKPDVPTVRGDRTKQPADPILETVRRLNLKATFIQGEAGFAVIDDRLYRVGQRLEAPGAGTSLVLSAVSFHHVTLIANGRSFRVSYPDRLTDSSGPHPRRSLGQQAGNAAILSQDPNLALIQMLLRSPLAGVGRSMLNPLAGPATSGPPRSSAE